MTDSQAKSEQPPSAKRGVDEEIDLLDYVRVVWRYRWMVLALCLLAMGVAVATSLRQPRVYQSAAMIVPPLDILQKESGGGLGGLSNSFLRQVMDMGTGSITKIYVEILESREVADAIVDRFRLMDVYKDVRYRFQARARLKTRTSTKMTNGGAVRITVTDTDPNRAAAIVGAYVDELDKQNKKLWTGQATSKRLFLENRLKEVEGKLSKIDNILSSEAKIQEIIYEWLMQQYEMAKMEEAKSLPTIQVIDSPAVPELGMPRGTIRKGVTAGIATFLAGVFLAFAREYVVHARHGAKEMPPARSRGSEDAV